MASTATFNCTATVEVSPVLRVVVTVGDGSTTLTDPWKLMRTNADGSQDEVRVPAYNPGSGTDEVLYDYEAAQGTTVSYQVVFSNAAANALLDALGERLPASLAIPDVGVFLVPTQGDQSLAVRLDVTGDGIAGWDESATVSSVQIIGSDMPFTVSQTRQAPAGQLTVQQTTRADHDAIRACLKVPGAKLVSFPMTYWATSGVSYVFVSGVQHVPQGSMLVPWWTSILTLIPTSRPPAIPVSSIQPMGSMTIQQAMSVTVDEAMDRPLS